MCRAAAGGSPAATAALNRLKGAKNRWPKSAIIIMPNSNIVCACILVPAKPPHFKKMGKLYTLPGFQLLARVCRLGGLHQVLQLHRHYLHRNRAVRPELHYMTDPTIRPASWPSTPPGRRSRRGRAAAHLPRQDDRSPSPSPWCPALRRLTTSPFGVLSAKTLPPRNITRVRSTISLRYETPPSSPRITS